MFTPIIPGAIVHGAKPGPLPFKWMATVREKRDGKEFTYWLNGGPGTAQGMAEHLIGHYPGIDVITVQLATKRPDKILMPIPPSHFRHAIIDERMAAELLGKEKTSSIRRPVERFTFKKVQRLR